MYEGMVDTRGLIMWSKKDESRSVGPLQPLIIGLIQLGFLWSFLRKYIRCVLTLSEGCSVQQLVFQSVTSLPPSASSSRTAYTILHKPGRWPCLAPIS